MVAEGGRAGKAILATVSPPRYRKRRTRAFRSLPSPSRPLLGGDKEGGRREEGGRRKEEGGRRKEEGGRRKEEGGRRKEEGGQATYLRRDQREALS
jgi:hypothetical protein